MKGRVARPDIAVIEIDGDERAGHPPNAGDALIGEDPLGVTQRQVGCRKRFAGDLLDGTDAAPISGVNGLPRSKSC